MSQGCNNCQNTVVYQDPPPGDSGGEDQTPVVTHGYVAPQGPCAEVFTSVPDASPPGPTSPCPTAQIVEVHPSQGPTIDQIIEWQNQGTFNEVTAAADKVINAPCDPEPPCPPPKHPHPDLLNLNTEAESCGYVPGSDLATSWTKAAPAKRMRLLGRVGRKLASLVGEGFLKLDAEGFVSATQNVSIKVSRLWHKYVIPNAGGRPVVGDPLDHPYIVVGDENADPYLIKGLQNEDSIPLWKHEEQVFRATPASQFPQVVAGSVPDSTQIEITGYTPIPENSQNPETPRPLQKFSGEGIPIFKKVPTTQVLSNCPCPECQTPQPGFTHVIDTLDKPDCATNLIVACIDGVIQWVDPSTIDSLKGETGNQGIQGIPGESIEGPVGPRGGKTCCPCDCVTNTPSSGTGGGGSSNGTGSNGSGGNGSSGNGSGGPGGGSGPSDSLPSNSDSSDSDPSDSSDSSNSGSSMSSMSSESSTSEPSGSSEPSTSDPGSSSQNVKFLNDDNGASIPIIENSPGSWGTAGGGISVDFSSPVWTVEMGLPGLPALPVAIGLGLTPTDPCGDYSNNYDITPDIVVPSSDSSAGGSAGGSDSGSGGAGSTSASGSGSTSSSDPCPDKADCLDLKITPTTGGDTIVIKMVVDPSGDYKGAFGGSQFCLFYFNGQWSLSRDDGGATLGPNEGTSEDPTATEECDGSTGEFELGVLTYQPCEILVPDRTYPLVIPQIP